MHYKGTIKKAIILILSIVLTNMITYSLLLKTINEQEKTIHKQETVIEELNNQLGVYDD